MDIKKYSNNFLILIFLTITLYFSVKNLKLFLDLHIKNSSYTYVTRWGSCGSEDGQFKSITVAVDSDCNVYSADHLNNRIQKFDSSGKFIKKWGSYGYGRGLFNDPRGIAVDRGGSIYIADTGNNLIQKFALNGNFITQWGERGFGNGQLLGPEAVCVDREGYVYVSDGGGKIHLSSIHKFTSEGKFLCKWLVYYNRNRIYSHRLSDISVDGNGNIYVLYWNEVPFSIPYYGVSTCIYKFDRKGNFLKKWEPEHASGDNPTGMALDRKGNLFICYLNRNFVYKYNPSGKLITELIPEDASQWRFNHPSDMAVDIKGNVYVADFSNYSIQKYSPVADNKKFSGYTYIGRFFK